jgi:hypothetical protein
MVRGRVTGQPPGNMRTIVIVTDPGRRHDVVRADVPIQLRTTLRRLRCCIVLVVFAVALRWMRLSTAHRAPGPTTEPRGGCERAARLAVTGRCSSPAAWCWPSGPAPRPARAAAALEQLSAEPTTSPSSAPIAAVAGGGCRPRRPRWTGLAARRTCHRLDPPAAGCPARPALAAAGPPPGVLGLLLLMLGLGSFAVLPVAVRFAVAAVGWCCLLEAVSWPARHGEFRTLPGFFLRWSPAAPRPRPLDRPWKRPSTSPAAARSC